MRFIELQVAGFRAFGTKATFDLDADVVIINGANGQGKTSLFDSILWGLSGVVPRISSDDKGLLSKFSDTGQIEVTVKFKDDLGQQYLVRRSFDGEQQRVRFEIGDEVFRESNATEKLQSVLWPGAKVSVSPELAVAQAITRTVYLQQDVLRDFLTRDDEQSRFSCIAELIGVGQLSDLRGQLDRARTAWSTITNQRAADLEQRERKIKDILNELLRRADLDVQRLDELAWTNWWTRVRELIPDLQPPDPAQPHAAGAIDRTLRTLQGQLTSLLRRRDLISSLGTEYGGHMVTSSINIDTRKLSEDLARAREEVDRLSAELVTEKLNEASLQRVRAESKTLQEKTALFATLALQFLDSRCPVCAQDYDIQATRVRLESLAKSKSEVDETGVENITRRIEKELQEAQQSLAVYETNLRKEEFASRQHEQALASLRSQLTELGIEIGLDSERSISTSLADIEERIGAIEGMIREGEIFSLVILRLSDLSRTQELRNQHASLELEVATQRREVEERRKVWQLATDILDVLREAEDSVVQLQLEEINPLFQRIYSRIDPNPVFRSVSLVSTFVNRRGHLKPHVSDATTSASCSVPEQVLSSSQVNALALSLFVALNFGLPKLPLRALLMDDPLQSLDEISLLGVVDLLRRAKLSRQLLVSTHDERFVGLLQRKLRSTQSDERMITIILSGWRREGPEVEIVNARPDLRPMRIAV